VKNSLEQSFKKFEDKKKRPPKPKKAQSLSRLLLIVGAGVGLLLSVNLAVYLQKTQIEDVRVEKLNRLAQQRAEISAQTAENYIKNIRSTLSLFAQKATLNAALVIGEQKTLDASAEAIKKQIDDVIAVQFIPKGKAVLNQNTVPPLRFTELEMIRRAEARENVLPEAAKLKDKWIINFIEPLPHDRDQDVTGIMLVSVEVDSLKTLLAQGRLTLGELTLTQKFGSLDPLTVFSIGQGEAGDAVSHVVRNSYWSVRFIPSHTMAQSAQIDAHKVYALMLALGVGLVVLFGFAGLFVGRIVEKRRQQIAVPSAVEAESGVSVKPSDLTDPIYQSADILDIDIVSEDEDLLGLEDVSVPEAQVSSEDILDIAEDRSDIPDVVFRAYDIRGIAKDQITNELARLIGQAVGSEAIDNGQDTLIVARDARLTSPELTEWLIRGILSSGCHVLNIGTVPTPLMYFAAATLQESQSGVMVTASHNPKEFNGFKLVMNGKSRSGEDVKAIRRRIIHKDIYEGAGEERHHEIVGDYVDTIFSDVALAGDISIVIDAGNGVTGTVAPKLFEELGCHVTPLFCNLDGNFPNHSPDPSIESNLAALIGKVKETQADLGVAFDGDGDRLIVVTSTGRIIWPDQLLMLFAKDIVSRNPGADVVFDVKSTRHLVGCITSFGGRPIMWKTGHAPMKLKMQETGALLGGEYSGHIFIKDRWFGFDDGMYAAARLIEILSLQGEPLDAMFDEFPISPATPEIRVPVSEEKKFDIVEKLAKNADFGDGRITTIDGVRVDFPYGWGLVRASNTSANLTLRFEADDEESLHKVKAIIAKALKETDSSITINWES